MRNSTNDLTGITCGCVFQAEAAGDRDDRHQDPTGWPSKQLHVDDDEQLVDGSTLGSDKIPFKGFLMMRIVGWSRWKESGGGKAGRRCISSIRPQDHPGTPSRAYTAAAAPSPFFARRRSARATVARLLHHPPALVYVRAIR